MQYVQHVQSIEGILINEAYFVSVVIIIIIVAVFYVNPNLYLKLCLILWWLVNLLLLDSLNTWHDFFHLPGQKKLAKLSHRTECKLFNFS